MTSGAITCLCPGIVPRTRGGNFSRVGNNSSGVSSSSLMRSFLPHKSQGQEVPPEVQAFFFPPPIPSSLKPSPWQKENCEWGGPGPGDAQGRMWLIPGIGFYLDNLDNFGGQNPLDLGLGRKVPDVFGVLKDKNPLWSTGKGEKDGNSPSKGTLGCVPELWDGSNGS